jgi:hypothetical protein
MMDVEKLELTDREKRWLAVFRELQEELAEVARTMTLYSDLLSDIAAEYPELQDHDESGSEWKLPQC